MNMADFKISTKIKKSMTMLSCGSPDMESTRLMKQEKDDNLISEFLK
jgi:hypothetical protein